MAEKDTHKSGFVNIIGRPNAGKSTLMNALVGERMSIITAKPQTTRHRIIGILNAPDYQIVFSDTPGIIRDPAYKMQEVMNRFVATTFEDADLMLLLVDIHDAFEEDDPMLQSLHKLEVPVALVLNKIDTGQTEAADALEQRLTAWMAFDRVFRISALKQTGVAELLAYIVDQLPQGPPYYPKDQLTDRPERFFVAEIIREKILEIYHQEVPYSVEVDVESFKEVENRKGEPLVRISAILYVSRKTQKPIIIGKGGTNIKKLGMEARKSIEAFLEKKVFLELHVKIRENWRDDERQLGRFGYQ